MKNRYSAISVDDEIQSHKILKSLLTSIADIELVQCYTSADVALEYFKTESCDLLFLDIDMPEINGIELLKKIQNPPITILVTAHAEYALEAYELGVRDYLLKPFSVERLKTSIENVRELLKVSRGSENRTPSYFSIKCGNENRLIKLEHLMRLEADGNFSVLYMKNESIFASETLKTLEDRLTPFGFIRVHKSHLVNASYVCGLRSQSITMLNDEHVPVGRAYKARTMAFLNL